MKRVVLIVAASCLFYSVCLAADSGLPAKPNILFILADDLGQRDLGCYGSQFYETPNLDRLAQDGARFTDGYAACPVCSPTRASIMTGQWPQRTGITDYIGAPLEPHLWKRNTKMLPAPYTDRLALDATTLAESLKAAGYATFFAGKWHLGPEGYWPENQGFDINMGGIERGGPYGGNKYFSPYGNPRLPDGPPGEHLPDRLATETAKFIEANKDRPFLAYFASYSVHTPLMAREDLRRKYEEKRERLGLQEKWGREETRDVRLVQEHAVYAAMVEALDLAVGKVLAKLDELGLRENTLVIFTSDNGAVWTRDAVAAEHRTNGVLLGQKTDAWEGGHRVPLVARWPGRIPPGSERRALFTQVDLMATLAEAAGAQLPDGASPDGQSDLAAFTDPEQAPAKRTEALFLGTGGHALRQGDWLYIPKQGSAGFTVQVPPGKPWGQPYAKTGQRNSDVDAQGQVKPDAPPAQLYNLRDDLPQTTNRFRDEPEITKRLAARLDELLPKRPGSK